MSVQIVTSIVTPVTSLVNAVTTTGIPVYGVRNSVQIVTPLQE